jgi:hypothetical protein
MDTASHINIHGHSLSWFSSNFLLSDRPPEISSDQVVNHRHHMTRYRLYDCISYFEHRNSKVMPVAD